MFSLPLHPPTVLTYSVQLPLLYLFTFRQKDLKSLLAKFLAQASACHLLIKVSMCEVVEDSAWHSLLLSVLSSLCYVVSCECCQTQHEMERWNVESRLFGSRMHMSSASRSFAWQCRGGNGQCQLAVLNILVSHFELGSRGSMNVWLRQFYNAVLYITQLLQQLPQIDCVDKQRRGSPSTTIFFITQFAFTWSSFTYRASCPSSSVASILKQPVKSFYNTPPSDNLYFTTQYNSTEKNKH